jgi:hypothetical protein
LKAVPGNEASRWVPLRHYLSLKRVRQQELELTFRQIEDILGDGLPKLARKHAEWWSNDGASEQARAWMGAGWRVRDLDLAAERVLFEPQPQ